MIALDANVVVRLLVEDDERQLGRSLALLGSAAERGESVLVTDIALCELEWVLDSAYSVPRERIVAAVGALLSDDRFAFEDRSRAAEALRLYQAGSGDLSDYLLGLRAEAMGARTTFTFDRAMRDDPRFTLLTG